MPLHLLGKKSWNVYNADNIATVKRDEAAAAAHEEAEEQRQQEADAERRIAILRGLPVKSPTPPPEKSNHVRRREDRPVRERKRRRIGGEDDTDRDIRFAQEDNAGSTTKAEMQMTSRKSGDTPLMDHSGHINLFPVQGSRHRAPKNAEAEAEKLKRQKENEDQYTMRFSNAAGFKQALGQEPWYHAPAADVGELEAPQKDVWGNEDRARREREKSRTTSDDPLAAMHKGVSGVRQAEKDRQKWKEEKAREIQQLEKDERRKEEKRRKRRDADDPEELSLDAPLKADVPRHGEQKYGEKRSRHSHSHCHHHRHRSQSRDRGGHRSHRKRHGSPPGWEVGPGGRYSSQFAHT